MQDTLASRKSYNFNLPQELIATAPIYPKEYAKLLVYRNGEIIHSTFTYLFDFIPMDYNIILNDTKVIKARFYVNKINATTRRECLYHGISNNNHIIQIRGRSKANDEYILSHNSECIRMKILYIRNDGFREVAFFKDNKEMTYEEMLALLQTCGAIPLPPYMKRESNKSDDIDYQSIFASKRGALAAPTASLHFSKDMFRHLCLHYSYAFVTLHIGAGTFSSIKVADIRDHNMHSEYCMISKKARDIINSKKRILCIGTTVARSVEWFARHKLAFGNNDIFLHAFNPPNRINALLTNFHLPESSLIMLVSSIIGLDETMRVYKEAIDHKYRFYSYGDGMLII